MICNKCGTSIKHEEKTCSFCGAINNVSSHEIISDIPEIIDFVEPEIIDFTAFEDDIVVGENVQENPVQPEGPAPVAAPSVTPITTAPVPEATQKIQIKEIQDAVKEEMAKDVPSAIPVADSVSQAMPNVIPAASTSNSSTSVSESTPIVVTSPTTKEKEEIEEVVSETEEDEAIISNGLDRKSIFAVVLAFLLIISVLLNIFLFVSSEPKKNEQEGTEISETKLTGFFKGYKLEIPSNWISITDSTSNSVTLTDSSKKWAATINVALDTDFSLVETNAKAIVEAFGKYKYLLITDYSKKLEENKKDYYIFKGKYYNYVTYIITTDLNSTNTVVADLKFKDEVDESVLKALMSAMGTIASQDLTDFYSQNFTFGNMTKVISNNLVETNK